VFVIETDSVHCEVQPESEERAKHLAYITYGRTFIDETVAWVGLKTEKQPTKEVTE
jgi:hypothetical protein